MTRQRMVQQANTKCTDMELEEDTWVYVKLQQHCQSSVVFCPSQKLAKKYFRPFRIVRELGGVAYELDLSDSQICPVPFQSPFLTWQLVDILGHHHLQNDPTSPEDVLVQCSNESPTDATCEPFAGLLAQFP
ncbi:hypothetical protein Sango_2312700 [Sesamum angolense]|uniref:Tf2-1-like SH3-like domain-containing protein n=1 Tax=Sesamum angolense TaxID=2727404 RepID=A0AAE1WAI8_9LAMI|nr:hypothetical protein Sango_2312700 [Sesamum angolense]